MFNIPENNLPDCLKDQNRINVLFAPLRNKSVNSKDWEDKISTWKFIIKVYCETNDIYSFTLSSLNEVFIRHGRPPPCLKEVIDDMIRNRDVEVIEIFLRKTSHTWSGWLTDMVIKRPLSWSYNAMKKTVFSTVSSQYVHLEVVKNKSENFLSLVPDLYKNKVVSFKELLQILNKDISNTENIKLLLHVLENQQKIAVKVLTNHNESNDLDTLLIKIGDGKIQKPITDIDVGIYTLEQNEKLISKHVEDLEDEIDSCIKEAKNHLAKKHRQLAKSCLVKKHQLEKQLEKKANALHNVQNCLEQLKGTHTNVHVWEAYKNAISAFNSTYKDTGINEEAVDDTMLKLGEVLDTNEDIQSALARPTSDEDDTSALEQELEELLKADTDAVNQDQPPNNNSGDSDELEKAFDKLGINFPDVPKDSPDISREEVASNN